MDAVDVVLNETTCFQADKEKRIMAMSIIQRTE